MQNLLQNQVKSMRIRWYNSIKTDNIHRLKKILKRKLHWKAASLFVRTCYGNFSIWFWFYALWNISNPQISKNLYSVSISLFLFEDWKLHFMYFFHLLIYQLLGRPNFALIFNFLRQKWNETATSKIPTFNCFWLL